MECMQYMFAVQGKGKKVQDSASGKGNNTNYRWITNVGLPFVDKDGSIRKKTHKKN